MSSMRCSWCHKAMHYVHGHAACVNGACPMFGVNQAECCDGEQAENCPAPSANVRAAPARMGVAERR